jgi:hypothetical protein
MDVGQRPTKSHIIRQLCAKYGEVELRVGIGMRDPDTKFYLGREEV